MKKIIKIVLILFVTLTLGACGSSEEKDTNKHTKTEEKKEETTADTASTEQPGFGIQ